MILLTALLIYLSTVSADIRNFVDHSTTESWISGDNFTSLIRAAFSRQDCLSVFVFDDYVGTERLFKEFVNVYPRGYMINVSEKGCHNYLIIATSIEKAVGGLEIQNLLDRKIEFLFVFERDIGDPMSGKLQWLRGFYAKSNIAARNGLFTLSDWKMYYTREIVKVSRINSIAHTNSVPEMVNMLYEVVASYNPPFSFLRTSVDLSEEVFRGEVNIGEEEGFDGVEVKLFLLFAKQMGFQFQMRRPVFRNGFRNETKWGLRVSIAGLLRMPDIALGGIWRSRETYEFSEMSIPWGQINLHFLVPRPKPHSSFWALTTPLSIEVWAALIAVLIAQTVFVYTGAWINSEIPNRFRSFTRTWVEMMARLLGTWAPREMKWMTLQFQLWHFTGVLMITAYSSSLASKLANMEFDRRIDTLEDFFAANLTWGSEGPIPPFSSFLDYSDPESQKLMDQYEHEANENERHEKILKGNYAIIGYRIGSTFVPFDTIRNDDLRGYRLMRDSISVQYISFEVSRDFIDIFNMFLLRINEAGLGEYHLNDVLYRRTSFQFSETLVEHDFNTGAARILELKPLGAGFVLYFFGLIISTIAFYFELRSARGSRSIREVFCDIKKYHEIWQTKELKRKRVLSAYMKLKRKRYSFACA